METMLLIPVDDSVVFPGMAVTLTIDVGDEEQVLLVPRKGEEFASVGTVAEVAERARLPGGGGGAPLPRAGRPAAARGGLPPGPPAPGGGRPPPTPTPGRSAAGPASS